MQTLFSKVISKSWKLLVPTPFKGKKLHNIASIVPGWINASSLLTLDWPSQDAHYTDSQEVHGIKQPSKAPCAAFHGFTLLPLLLQIIIPNKVHRDTIFLISALWGNQSETHPLFFFPNSSFSMLKFLFL